MAHLLAAAEHGRFRVEAHTLEQYQPDDSTADVILQLWVSQAIEIDLADMIDTYFPDIPMKDVKIKVRTPGATLIVYTIEKRLDNMTFKELKEYLKRDLCLDAFASYLYRINNGTYFSS